VVKHTLLANRTARNIALSLFISICVGNLLCELGNLLAVSLRHHPHYFNTSFFILGIIGIVGFGYALFCRRNNNHSSDVDVE
jgi:hypothetical protein